MTLAIAPTPAARSYRPIRRGWRARYPGDFPTLGWLVLDWTYAYLPSPANEKKPLVYTDEQARRILEWFRLDPLTGALVRNRRLHLQEAKGFGKSPFAASLALAEFCGPVCFDGWDADGQPVGVPWGVGGRPVPWIQIAAVSEAQTKNTYGALHVMLTANDGHAADSLRIDAGVTRCLLLKMPGALLEYVTASFGTREGQRLTAAVLDEPQLWWPSNGGHKLVDTILGNLTKMDGRAVFTGNAYVKGEESVAERYDFDEPGVLRYARRPAEEPEQDWSRERLLAGLRHVYEGAPWAPLERIVEDATSPTANWPRMKRLFWNLPASGSADRWMPELVWDACAGDVVFDRAKPVYAVVVIDHDHRACAAAIAQRQGELVLLRIRHFLSSDDYLDLAELELHLLSLRQRYRAPIAAVRHATHRSREVLVSAPGPEVAYHGMFFERSAQALRARGLTLIDIPPTPERLAPAAEALMELAIAGQLVHDGDPVLAEQMGRVVATETTRGWTFDGERIPAPRAAIVAVHRALTAPAAPSRRVRLH